MATSTHSTTKARVVTAPSGTVTVHVSAEALYNLDEIQRLQRTVLGRLGCPTCTSGRYIVYQQEESEFEVG